MKELAKIKKDFRIKFNAYITKENGLYVFKNERGQDILYPMNLDGLKDIHKIKCAA